MPWKVIFHWEWKLPQKIEFHFWRAHKGLLKIKELYMLLKLGVVFSITVLSEVAKMDEFYVCLTLIKHCFIFLTFCILKWKTRNLGHCDFSFCLPMFLYFVTNMSLTLNLFRRNLIYTQCSARLKRISIIQKKLPKLM